jgi:hypothetical protein
MLLALLVAAGCTKETPAPKNELEVFERAFVRESHEPHYRWVYIGHTGIYIDRTLIATLAELDGKRAAISAAIDANAKLAESSDTSVTVTWNLDKEPASVAIAALRLFADRKLEHRRMLVDPSPAKATEFLGLPMIHNTPAAQKSDVQLELSVLLDQDGTWLGISRLNEFQEIPNTPQGRDVSKLGMVLKEHKASTFFAGRNQLEIAAKAGTAADVLTAAALANQHEFTEVAVLPPEQLSANPDRFVKKSVDSARAIGFEPVKPAP